MAYSSVADVRNALSLEGSATDPATAASLSEAQLGDAIAEADGIISMYVGTRYTIPQDTTATPPSSVAVSPIRWWSRTIAAYLATLTFKRNQDVPADEPVRLRYDEVMKMLESVRIGDLELPFTPVGQTDGSDVFVYNQYDQALFPSTWVGPSASGWEVSRYTKIR